MRKTNGANVSFVFKTMSNLIAQIIFIIITIQTNDVFYSIASFICDIYRLFF